MSKLCRSSLGFFILFCLLFGVVISFCLWLYPTIETSYRMRRLAELKNESPILSSGFLIDETVDEANYHRNRLVALGRLFRRSYPLFAKTTEEERKGEARKMVLFLERNHGDVYWELHSDGTFYVWDNIGAEKRWDEIVAKRPWMGTGLTEQD